MSSKEGSIHLEWKYADDFKRVYATNAFGIVGEYDYRLLFGGGNVLLQQDPNSIPKAQGEYNVELVFSFRTLKELRNMVDEAVKNVEMRFGEIKLPKKPEDYFKQP